MRFAEIDPRLFEDAADLGGNLRFRDLPDLTLGECLRLVSIHNTPRRSREQTLLAAAVARQNRLDIEFGEVQEQNRDDLARHPLRAVAPSIPGLASTNPAAVFLDWLLRKGEPPQPYVKPILGQYEALEARLRADGAPLDQWVEEHAERLQRLDAVKTARRINHVVVRKRLDMALKRDVPLLVLLRIGETLTGYLPPLEDVTDEDGFAPRPEPDDRVASAVFTYLNPAKEIGTAREVIDWAQGAFDDLGYPIEELHGTIVQMLNAVYRRKHIPLVWVLGFQTAIRHYGEDTTLRQIVVSGFRNEDVFRRSRPPSLLRRRARPVNEDASAMGGGLSVRAVPDLTFGECLRLVSVHGTPYRPRGTSLLADALAARKRQRAGFDAIAKSLDDYLREHPLLDVLKQSDFATLVGRTPQPFDVQDFLVSRARRRHDRQMGDRTDQRSAAFNRIEDTIADRLGADLDRWTAELQERQERSVKAMDAWYALAEVIDQRWARALARDPGLLLVLWLGEVLNMQVERDPKNIARDVGRAIKYPLEPARWAKRFAEEHVEPEDCYGTAVQMLNAACRRAGLDEPWIKGYRNAIALFGEDATFRSMLFDQLGDAEAAHFLRPERH